MIRRPPRSTRTDTLFPYTTLFRSATSCLLLCASGFPVRWAPMPALSSSRLAPGRALGGHALGGHALGDQPVDHPLQRLLLVGAVVAGLAEHLELAVGRGAAPQDLAGKAGLLQAAERLGVVVSQREDLLQQVLVRGHHALAEVDQAVVHAIALGAPAVLVDQHVGILAPALVIALQDVEIGRATSELQS